MSHGWKVWGWSLGLKLGVENSGVEMSFNPNKELLDGQEDIGALEAELDAKLSQVESCLEDLSLEQRGLVQSIKAIDNLDPEALDADKGIAFISPEKYY